VPPVKAPERTSAATARLACRRPFDWHAFMAYYRLRAIPGVEASLDGRYLRALRVGGREAIVEVRDAGRALEVTIDGAGDVEDVRERAAAVFDVAAPVGPIRRTLERDPRLRALLARQPGVRVPGCWDGFELAVRAILGQQISVRAATTIAGRIAARYGTPLGRPAHGLTHLFPEPARLRRARFPGIGLVRSRGDTLRRLAAAVDDGEIHFRAGQDPGALRARLTAIRGIGEWTAQYVLMRALKWPDALPASDLGLIKSLEPGTRVTPKELAGRAEAWRPFRAYGAMLLWGDGAAGGG